MPQVQDGASSAVLGPPTGDWCRASAGSPSRSGTSTTPPASQWLLWHPVGRERASVGWWLGGRVGGGEGEE